MKIKTGSRLGGWLEQVSALMRWMMFTLATLKDRNLLVSVTACLPWICFRSY